jgi:dolichol-phosphate mannosyltransferase
LNAIRKPQIILKKLALTGCMPDSITVIIPTFNEAGNLPTLVSKLFSLPLDSLSVPVVSGQHSGGEYTTSRCWTLNILVVDDHSPDGTGEIADRLAVENPGQLAVIHRPGKLGLGTAYLAGFQHALATGSRVIAQMDADFSHPPEKLVELIQILADCDLAMGSRYIPGGSVDQRWPLWRRALSAFGNFYARSILNLPVRDATGGFRAWRCETLQALPLDQVHSDGYAFQVEMVFLACIYGFRVSEIPIYFADRHWGTSKMSFRIQREAALRVWQLRFEYAQMKHRDVR